VCLKVDLIHIYQDTSEPGVTDVIPHGIDLKEFYQSVEWDILNVPASKHIKRYDCCSEPQPDITFNITIRRKTLFHTVNLIIPCVAITFLTVIVFHLPSDRCVAVNSCTVQSLGSGHSPRTYFPLPDNFPPFLHGVGYPPFTTIIRQSTI